jgi:hypothetical protein
MSWHPSLKPYGFMPFYQYHFLVLVGMWTMEHHDSHMTFNKKISASFKNRDVGIQVELGDDATYPVTRIGTISFRMPLGDVLNLHDVLFVPRLTKNLLYISTITYMKCIVEFYDQQCTIKDCNQELP